MAARRTPATRSRHGGALRAARFAARLVVLAVAAACASGAPSPSGVRVGSWVAGTSDPEEAWREIGRCIPGGRDLSVTSREESLRIGDCLHERGFRFRPDWKAIPDREQAPASEAQAECLAGREVERHPVDRQLFVQCMNEKGWSARD